jgi:hypothetical protein
MYFNNLKNIINEKVYTYIKSYKLRIIYIHKSIKNLLVTFKNKI